MAILFMILSFLWADAALTRFLSEPVLILVENCRTGEGNTQFETN
jgi:hypothetical protein